MTAKRATAFAPATVANVAVGFDVLGFALEQPGDRVSVAFVPGSGPLTIEVRSSSNEISCEPERNTAAVAAQQLAERVQLEGRLTIVVKKGIPLASGLGGSAASAVASVVALNHLLGKPLSRAELLQCALSAEAAASGAAHADNVSACLLGGLQLVLPTSPPEPFALPVPRGLRAVVVHPALQVETRRAREILKPSIALDEHVRQSACLAGFVTGLHRGDVDVLKRTMVDGVIAPQRSILVPGFDEARVRAMAAGAIGFSLSGSGPSVFAWVRSPRDAVRVGGAVRAVFKKHGLRSVAWTSILSARGARVLRK